MTRVLPARRPVRSAGFAMLEALVALAIGGFGLMSVVRLQVGLQAESDLAKQTSEATFIAQGRIEELRAFQQINAASAANLAAGQWGYLNIGSGAQTVNGTNAVYNTSWVITNAIGGVRSKTAVVNVNWTDRRNQPQVASLSTEISGTDPATSLQLSIPPSGTPIRRPKNRDLNIPVPALDLGNGTSAFTPPGAPANLRLVFNNLSGLITKRCTGTGNDPAAWACVDLSAYLVTGYISFGTGSLAPAANVNSAIDLTISLAEGVLQNCYDDSASTTKTYAGFITYTCLVTGADHDSNPSTRARWSGRLDLTGIAIANDSTGDRICRYSYDYDADGIIQNNEHPASYSQVTESLENQNFVVIAGNRTCPVGASSLQVAVQHQP